MKYKEMEDYYLCVLASHGKVYDFKIGVYNKRNDSFLFPNGSYGPTEVYEKPTGSSSTYVKRAICLQEIDDKFDLLHEELEG